MEKFLEKSGGNTRIYFGCQFSHEHHLVMRTLQLRGLGGMGGGGEGAVSLPTILLYISLL